MKKPRFVYVVMCMTGPVWDDATEILAGEAYFEKDRAESAAKLHQLVNDRNGKKEQFWVVDVPLISD